MNDLVYPLLWSALQVTLLALAALVSTLATRRAPATAARLTTLALFGCAVLTVLAFCPLPKGWNWNTGRTVLVAELATSDDSEADRTATDSPEQIESTATGHGWNFTNFAASRWWPRLRATTEPAFPTGDRSLSWLVVVLLGSALVGLLRLLFGMWAVERCRRRSTLITDLELLQLREQLYAAIGISPTVELRESRDLTAPATVGWLRPTVLLPADWRTWTADDCRAVLAHELAHVQRRDYVAWLLARFVLALHFYHPLLYWLAARLRLQQELAADALAAEHAGGATNYLRALARLALRQDGRRDAAPTLAFLSSPGTLLRRIAMLRATDGRPCRLSRGVRGAGFVFLILVALGVSALRAPAEKPVPSDAPKAQASETPRVEPFELSYLAANANMVMAIRPSAIFSQTEMKQELEKANKAFADIQREFNADAKPLLHMEDIDQIVFSGVMQTNKKAEPGRQTMLTFNGFVVRTVKDFDWKNLLTSLIGEVEAISFEGKTCYRPSKEDFRTKALARSVGGEEVCFYIVDRHTLVVDTKEGLSALLRGRTKKAPAPPWQEDWKHVERSLFAVAFVDARALNERSEPDTKLSKEMRTLIRNTTSFVSGLDWSDGLKCQTVLRSPNEQAAIKNVALVKDLIAMGRTTVGKSDASKEATRESKTRTEALLTNCEVRLEDITVILRSSTKASFADVMDSILSGDLSLGL